LTLADFLHVILHVILNEIKNLRKILLASKEVEMKILFVYLEI
jgi:hypothetical protein